MWSFEADLARTLAAIIKAVTKDKKKAKVPAPTAYDGSKEGLSTFFREMKEWLEDNKVTEDGDKVNVSIYKEE